MDELRVRMHADLQSSTMSVDEAAAVLGQAPDIIWRYVRSGELAHIRVQGAEAIEYRILSRDVHDLQSKLRAASDQPGSTIAGDRAQAGTPQRRQPIGARLAAVDSASHRPSMSMMRPPTGPLKAEAVTITRAGGFGLPSASSDDQEPAAPEESWAEKTSDQEKPDITSANSDQPAVSPSESEVRSFMASATLAPPTGGGTSAATGDATAAEAPSDAQAMSNAATTASSARSEETPGKERDAAQTKRPALPPINSVVTVSGTALHREPHPGFSESDALRVFRTLMESLVAPITAANDRLADENSRLLELARMQSQALEKVNSERDALIERLIGLPDEMRTLYERLGALQAEVHRLEQASTSRVSGPPERVVKTPHISWWRRLFGLE
jgi:hypothetical protein